MIPAALALGISIGPSASFELLPLALVALLYALRVLALERNGRPVAGRRQASFYLGLLLVGVCVVVLAEPTRRLFVAHAVSDVLVGDVAPLLLVLGLTGALLEPLRRIPGARLLRWLWHPVPAFLIWTVDLYGWHVARLYEAALRHGPLHTFQYVTSLAAGILMWICLLGPVPRPRWFGDGAKLLYIVSVRVAGAVLGNLLLWSGTIAYPFYLEGDALREISPVADQNLGGAIILLDQSLMLLGLFAWLYRRSRAPVESVPANGPLERLRPPAGLPVGGQQASAASEAPTAVMQEVRPRLDPTGNGRSL